MGKLKFGLLLGGTMLLSGCQVYKEAFYTESVNFAECTPLAEKGATDYDVTKFAVRVPRSLSVSESDTYHPSTDILWEEDPLGDRHAQVQTIVADAATSAFKVSEGGRPAHVGMEVRYFHALTDRTQATTGGWLTVTLDMTISDPYTSELLEPVYQLKTQIPGYGGQEAIDAIHRGETQKYRISRHLTQALQVDVLGICPTGYPAPVPLEAPRTIAGELPDIVGHP
ncbi:DUF6778 family protein [Pseudooceanicola algae]|uniref:Lipoprotein n=1 Tax=Pseudooceanicola algae TaxID=1537215 RepID=A0A418SDK5_9RHOB|nr:DUF6778 family protein [Pseudooceanicola algae]QPM89433.1 hypothetical protein PSAL_006520 [Pseudooceanicola algae]